MMQTRREVITSGLGLAAIIAAGKAPAAVVRSMVAARATAMGGGKSYDRYHGFSSDHLLYFYDCIDNVGTGVQDLTATSWMNLATMTSMSIGSNVFSSGGCVFGSDSSWCDDSISSMINNGYPITLEIGMSSQGASWATTFVFCTYGIKFQFIPYAGVNANIDAFADSLFVRGVGGLNKCLYAAITLSEQNDYCIYFPKTSDIKSGTYVRKREYYDNRFSANSTVRLLRLYDRVLSSQEIADHYAKSVSRYSLD